MSELVVGSIAGLASNSYVVDVSAGSTLDLSNATSLPSSALPTGSVLQVVSTTKTDTFSTTSTTPTALTGATVSITPKFASSKILVTFTTVASASALCTGSFQLKRDSTNIGGGASAGNRLSAISSVTIASQNYRHSVASNFLDSPATTSSITYSIDVFTSSGTFWIGRNNTDTDSNSADFVRTPSTITLMEIAG